MVPAAFRKLKLAKRHPGTQRTGQMLDDSRATAPGVSCGILCFHLAQRPKLSGSSIKLKPRLRNRPPSRRGINSSKFLNSQIRFRKTRKIVTYVYIEHLNVKRVLYKHALQNYAAGPLLAWKALAQAKILSRFSTSAKSLRLRTFSSPSSSVRV